MSEIIHTAKWSVTVGVDCFEAKCKLRPQCQKIRSQNIGDIAVADNLHAEMLVEAREQLTKELIQSHDFGVCTEAENPKQDGEIKLKWNPKSGIIFFNG